MIYLHLFWSFFKIGMFSIGGGYAAMPLIQNEVVTLNKWLTLKEFADIITISQMTPGPIAINSATFVGIQVAGFPGAIIATLGCVTPSFIIVISFPFEQTTVSMPFSSTVPDIRDIETADLILSLFTSSAVIPSNFAASPL